MKTLILSVLLTTFALPALAGPCTYPTDRASDGSLCGGRASTVRPGGK
jgi:hypothetical protein